MTKRLVQKKFTTDSLGSAVLRVAVVVILGAVFTSMPGFAQQAHHAKWIDSRSGHAGGVGHYDRKLPRSMANVAEHDVVGHRAVSSQNELGRLERNSLLQAGSGSHTTKTVQATRFSEPASHNAPINFSHQQQRNGMLTRAQRTPSSSSRRTRMY